MYFAASTHLADPQPWYWIPPVAMLVLSVPADGRFAENAQNRINMVVDKESLLCTVMDNCVSCTWIYLRSVRHCQMEHWPG